MQSVYLLEPSPRLLSSTSSSAVHCAVEGVPDLSLGGICSGLSHGLVLHHAGSELGLRLGHGRASCSVQTVYLKITKCRHSRVN